MLFRSCNPDALYRIPAEYDDEGYPISTPAREQLYGDRLARIKNFLQQVPALGTANGGGGRGAQAHLAVTVGTPERDPSPPPTPAPVGVQPPRPDPRPPSASPPVAAVTTSSASPPGLAARTAEIVDAYLAVALGGGANAGPFHYYGDNTDPATKERNMEEQRRRRKNKWCFLCPTNKLRKVHFLQCPFHGPQAQPGAPTVTRDRA